MHVQHHSDQEVAMETKKSPRRPVSQQSEELASPQCLSFVGLLTVTCSAGLLARCYFVTLQVTNTEREGLGTRLVQARRPGNEASAQTLSEKAWERG